MVVVENVISKTTVGPITGLLARLGGYTLREGALDPRRVAGAPMARDRQYWVLVKDGTQGGGGVRGERE